MNAMTVDVEDYFHVSAFASSIPRNQWERMPYRVESNTSKLLELFAGQDVRATFFVLGWVAERSAGLVREISEAGHEIACHGYSHELVYRQDPEVFREETISSKRRLEDITGNAVLGYRAASYSITPDSLWALDVIIDAGFKYDSSVFPIRHDVYGLPDAPLRPTRLKSPTGRELTEFPLSTAEIFGVRLPVAGGGYFRFLPYSVTRFGLLRINQHSSPFVFYLHPWEVDPGQPRIAAPWRSRFRHYTNIGRCAQRLFRLTRDFRFGRMDDVLAGLGLL